MKKINGARLFLNQQRSILHIMEKYVRDVDDIDNTINEYADLIYRTSFLILKNKADVDDIVQETFYKYMTTDLSFENENHKRAWLLKVSQNKCKDLLRSQKVRSYITYEEIEERYATEEEVEKKDIDEYLRIANLTYKNKSVIMLYYYEGYSIEEVAEILGISVSAAEKRLQRAREKIKRAFERNDKGGEKNYEIR